MATVNIALPDGMKHWAEEQAKTGRYADVSDYISDLIRRDQARAEKIAQMQRHVDEGLASGVGSRTPEELFDEATARAAAKSGR